jgi:hypothetical protein
VKPLGASELEGPARVTIPTIATVTDIPALRKSPFMIHRQHVSPVPRRNDFGASLLNRRRRRDPLRKLIAFDDDTFDKLKQLGRDRIGTLQELADEAFADLLKKHGIPIDLKDALRKSAGVAKTSAKAPAPGKARSRPARKSKS